MTDDELIEWLYHRVGVDTTVTLPSEDWERLIALARAGAAVQPSASHVELVKRLKIIAQGLGSMKQFASAAEVDKAAELIRALPAPAKGET